MKRTGESHSITYSGTFNVTEKIYQNFNVPYVDIYTFSNVSIVLKPIKAAYLSVTLFGI